MGKEKCKRKVDLGRKDDTVEDLYHDDMLGGDAWKTPRKKREG